MSDTRVGIRELKAGLSSYLRRVKAGNTLVVTERGKPVGRIVPARESLEERVRDLVEAEVVAWSGRRLGPIQPVARVRGQRTVAHLLLEDRE
jgi:prevent-host-death family protein